MNPRRNSARYLTRRLAAAHAVLADFTATDAQRHGARCRLNRAIDTLKQLEPIPPMRRRLQVDVLAEKQARRLGGTL